MPKKIKICVIFGGRSGEHEVSLVSASSIIAALAADGRKIIEIGITRSGQWYTGENCLEAFKKQKIDSLERVSLSTNPENPGIFIEDEEFARSARSHYLSSNPSGRLGKFIQIDFAFPVLHGPFGEDGTIQGLFEILQIPYAGSGVLASSTAMDKIQTKALLKANGIPVVPSIGINRLAWGKEKKPILSDIKENIGFPCFVKPSNMGSSVGISKVKKFEDLESAVNLACEFDSRILIEKAINAREIECAVLGNDDLIAAPVGEVIVGGEFYDFYDKYVNGVSTTEVPANIDKDVSDKIRNMSMKAYKILDCSGLSRVDFLLDRVTGEIYLNEINTMPGFTSISMYPKMMKEAGIGYEELVDRLVELGIERFKERRKNKVGFDSGSDWYLKN
ncbi:D-alanine--D-alanine ligase [Candidatus Peregrinibacteria bacterium]|nr:D-alanine--D-alanine ligase [Candidatus Peregrinibacteria bacterium]